jgi:hypothetical protein
VTSRHWWERGEEGAQRGHVGEQVAGDAECLGAADVRLAVVDEHGVGDADAQVVQHVLGVSEMTSP